MITLYRAKFVAVWLVLSIVGTTLAPLGIRTARAVSTVNPEETFTQIRDDAVQRCDPQSPQSGRGLGNALGKAGNSFTNQLQQGLSKSLSNSLEELFAEKLPQMLGRKMEQLVRRQQNKWLGELGGLIDRRVDSLVTRGYEDDEISGVLPGLIEETAREFFANLARNEIPNALRVELRLEAPRLIGEFYAPTGSDDPADTEAIASSEIRDIIEEEFGEKIDAIIEQAVTVEMIEMIKQITESISSSISSLRSSGGFSIVNLLQVFNTIKELIDKFNETQAALNSAKDGSMRKNIIDAMAYYATEGILNSNSLVGLGNRSAQIFLYNGLPRFTEYLIGEDSSGRAAQELGGSSFTANFVSSFSIGNRFADTISLVPGTVFNTLVSPTGSTFVESFRQGIAGGPSSEQLRNIQLNGFTGSANDINAITHAGRLSPTGFQALQNAGYDGYVTEDLITQANLNTGEPLLIDESFGATVDTDAPHMSDFQPPTNVDGLAADATSGIKANAGGIADHAAYSLNGLGESFKGTLSGSIANGLGNLVSGVPFAGPILATLVEDLANQLITPLLDLIIPTAGAGAALVPATAASIGVGTASAGVAEAHTDVFPWSDLGAAGTATAVAGVAATVAAVVSSLEKNFLFANALLGVIQNQTKVSNANEETIIKTEQEIQSLTTQVCIYEHTIEKVRVMVAQNELFYDRQASQRAALGIRNNFLNVQKYLQAGYAVSEGALGAEGSGGGVGGEQNSGQPLVANLPEDLELARRETTGVLLYELLEQSESPFREEIGEKLIASTQGTFAERMRPTISEEDRQKITTPGRGGEIEPERYRAVWNKLIEPQNNAPGAEYLVGEEHARRQAETEQNTRETLLANGGFRDSRICEVMVGTPGGPYCAKWKVLTPGSTLKAYWDRLLAAVLEQATNVQKAGQDFITNFFPEVERALVDSANSGRATGAPAPGLPASDPCPGPGPCPGTGWEAAAQNQDTGGLFDTAAIGRTLEDLLERGFNTLSDF